MIRRRIVLAYWVAAVALFMPEAVYAYIDPATTTYLIQIATALVVTIGVSLSIFLYRFRMISQKIRYWFYGLIYRSRTKDISKETDTERTAEPWSPPPFVIPGPAEPVGVSFFAEDIRDTLLAGRDREAAKKAGPDDSAPGTYGERVRLAIPLALAFSFVFIVVGCLELAIQHAPEIPFRISAIAPVVILCFAALFALIILIIPRFYGRGFEALLAIGLSVLTAGYIQGNFLNRGLGQLTGDQVIWSDFGPQIALSLLCWAGCFVLIVFLWQRARKAWRRLLIFVPLLVILFQGVGFISVVYNHTYENMLNENGIWASAGDFWKTADEALTIDRINEVASERNAIIIVLDRLDQEFIEEIAAEDPHFFDSLDGFTEFDDFITFNGSTFPSVPGYLTGHRFMFDMPRWDYFTYAWANADFFHTLVEYGVDARLYIERGQAYSRISQLGGVISNTFEGELEIDTRIALIKLLKLSGYRYAPMMLKQLFWFSPTEFIDTLVLSDRTAPYINDDFRYYRNLKEDGLSISEYTDEAFIYIHLQGSHPPLNMDENIQYVEESTLIAQTKGSFRIAYEYLRQLKELGLYEDSLVIIMGDHGNYTGDDLPGPVRTGLLVKPAGSSMAPLQVSSAPVSPYQLHATLMEGLFGDSGSFGDTFFDVSEGDDVVRQYAVNLWSYEIRGDGRDFANWTFMGRFPDTYYP